MFKFSDEIKDTLAATKFVWMATATKDGSPNVVIVAAFRLLDDETLLISDQYFLKTLANLKDNPKVAISWWGEKGGFQIKGNATIHTSGPIFKSNVEWMKVKWSRFGPKGAVVVKIIDAYVLRAGPDSGKRCYDSGLV
jgi:predicted pyridoxine 5'-phosphate oxidase superfamily flavin-nucleotide-binding protein